MTWPSTGPSGTEFYGSLAIPGWQNSLLVAQLKKGAIARLKLSNDGQNIISDTINYFQGLGRFRDIVVSPDGLKIYVACDSSGSTSGPTQNVTTSPANAGSILEFTYQPLPLAPEGKFIVQEKLDDHTIDVYPNPASDFLIVYNYRSVEPRTIQMIDMNGIYHYNKKSTSLTTRIETARLANGIYILKILDAKGKNVRTEKILIHH